MPIYEYYCEKCQKKFELLVFSSDTPECPECKSTDLKRMMSACGFISKDSSGRTSAKSAGTSSCSGCTQTSCAGCSS